MKIKILLLLFILQVPFCQCIFPQGKGAQNVSITKLPAKEKRFALIIGVDTYQKDISPLYGTVNDARALREVLIKFAGFTDEQIILMTTDSNDSDLIPTRGNIIDQLDKLSRVVPEDGLILFSFSGHGVSIGSDAFIVPSDGRIYQSANLMRERAIDVLRIKQAIQDTKVKQVIMFLDACRNDPVSGKGSGDNKLTTNYANGFSFDTKNQNIEAYATFYATSFGDRAYEFLDKKTGKYRGYFSYAIEEGLKGSAANDKGEVTLAGLVRYIEETVKERVRINENQKQIPYPTTEGFRNSDLVIAVAERNAPITTNINSGEATFWNAIENSNDIEDFENYLRRCDKGEFSCIYKATAELKLKRLNKNTLAKNNPISTDTVTKKDPKKDIQSILLEAQFRLLLVNKDGSDSEVNPTAAFMSNDRLRMAIKVNQAGYLYVIRQTSPREDGEFIFPTKLANNGSNAVKANVEYIFPRDCPSEYILNPRDCALTPFPYDKSPEEFFTLIFTRVSLANLVRTGKITAKTLTDLIENSGQDLAAQRGDTPFTIRITNNNAKNNDKIIETFVLNKAKR